MVIAESEMRRMHCSSALAWLCATQILRKLFHFLCKLFLALWKKFCDDFDAKTIVECEKTIKLAFIENNTKLTIEITVIDLESIRGREKYCKMIAASSLIFSQT